MVSSFLCAVFFVDTLTHLLLGLVAIIINIYCLMYTGGRRSAEGSVVYMWDSRGAALWQFEGPIGVVAMSAGAVWVADGDNNRLCLLD